MLLNEILKSSKKEGKHEAKIIEKLVLYFTELGYHVVPHARFNIAWGNILSDIDLLAVKGSEVSLIEVKSSKDNLQRAHKQLTLIEDFVDHTFIATDYLPRKFDFDNSGWLYVKEEVILMQNSTKIEKEPAMQSIESLPKECIVRYSQKKGLQLSKKNTKEELAQEIIERSIFSLKDELKEMVTCGQDCENNCPIWDFQETKNPIEIIQ